MATRHRPYRPKTKGCYECSQRRISCDRATPQCAKCVSKGLDCSGLDVRYRFTEGVAVRGKWAGESVQSLYQRLSEKPRKCKQDPNIATKLPIIPDLPDRSNFGQAAVSQRPADKVRRPHGCRGATWEQHNETSYADSPPDGGALVPSHERDDDEVTLSHVHSLSSHRNSASTSLTIDSMNGSLYEPSPDNLPHWQRRLLSHYSDHIALEMIAIDGPHNGWRHIVLPIAHTHPLVMNAVLAVSAFHVSLQEERKHIANDSLFHLPRKFLTRDRTSAEFLYDLTIRGLKQRQDLSKSDGTAKQSVLVTILVLLTAVMVNGRTDFPILFGMLDAAIKVVGGEDQLVGSELGEFITRQVRKMRVYAAPLISEHTGLAILSSPSHWEQLFDCLRYCSQTQPEHVAALDRIEDLVRQAHDIYLRQALHNFRLSEVGNATKESIDRLEHFKNTLEAFPTGSPGKQVLVWATFIAASDCILEDHKAFFEKALIENYNRSKFINVLEGLAQLRHIWAKRSEGIRWTHLLPHGQVFLM